MKRKYTKNEVFVPFFGITSIVCIYNVLKGNFIDWVIGVGPKKIVLGTK